jgi:hypothetical protein
LIASEYYCTSDLGETVGKFATGVNDTGSNLLPSVSNVSSRFVIVTGRFDSDSNIRLPTPKKTGHFPFGTGEMLTSSQICEKKIQKMLIRKSGA